MQRGATNVIAIRIASALVGTASIAGGVWQLWRGVPLQQQHAPLHTTPLLAPILLLVGAVLIVIACSPKRLWW
jgi:hypothetical protein